MRYSGQCEGSERVAGEGFVWIGIENMKESCVGVVGDESDRRAVWIGVFFFFCRIRRIVEVMGMSCAIVL